MTEALICSLLSVGCNFWRVAPLRLDSLLSPSVPGDLGDEASWMQWSFGPSGFDLLLFCTLLFLFGTRNIWVDACRYNMVNMCTSSEMYL